MKPLIEQLALGEQSSFLARTYRTPLFEVPWHQHVEHELILFTEGYGTCYIGNYIGEFAEGDIFFLGSNLPHCFQKAHADLVTAALVIQFRSDCCGPNLLQLPESEAVQHLLELSAGGLSLKGSCREQLVTLMQELEFAEGFDRIILLWSCLHVISSSNEYTTVSTQEIPAYHHKHQERMDRVFQYTIEHFSEPITLEKVAGYAGLSVPAFCNYFKKRTKKTYIEFLNEVRIGHACKLLIDTQQSVESVCYESGFNTLANFNKQFLKARNRTPMAYRKAFRKDMARQPMR